MKKLVKALVPVGLIFMLIAVGRVESDADINAVTILIAVMGIAFTIPFIISKIKTE